MIEGPDSQASHPQERRQHFLLRRWLMRTGLAALILAISPTEKASASIGTDAPVESFPHSSQTPQTSGESIALTDSFHKLLELLHASGDKLTQVIQAIEVDRPSSSASNDQWDLYETNAELRRTQYIATSRKLFYPGEYEILKPIVTEVLLAFRSHPGNSPSLFRMTEPPVFSREQKVSILKKAVHLMESTDKTLPDKIAYILFALLNDSSLNEKSSKAPSQ